MEYRVGIDVGGTAVKLGLFQAGTLLEKWEIPTIKGQILEDIAAAVMGCMERNGLQRAQVQGIGIGVPGPVTRDGVVNQCINLDWGVFNLHEALGTLTGLPVIGDNDANCAALGEVAQFGCRNAIFVTIGTGVGGGIIIDGKVLGGAHATAGEIGHITVSAPDKAQCTCGKRGCLEAYASATGIVRQYREATGTERTCAEIFAAAEAGEEAAQTLLEKVYDYLGEALASACCICDPEQVILGGGVARAGEPLRRGVEAAFDRHKFHACEGTKFALARLGNDAGIYGAQLLLEELT